MANSMRPPSAFRVSPEQRHQWHRPLRYDGESPTLSHDEYERVIEITVEMVHGRLPVIAGTGFNATDKTVEATVCEKAGADG